MAYALVVSVSAGSGTNDNVTTAGVDTTNATLLVAAVASGTGTRTISDSKTNTWTALTRRNNTTNSLGVQLYYVAAPTVGAAHTFTVTSTAQFPAIAVAAYSGATVPTVAFDREVGAIFDRSGGVLEAETGGLTPRDAASLVVSGIAFNDATGADAASGMTVRENFNATANAYGVDLADAIQTAPVAITPRWSWTTATVGAVALASFTLLPGTTSDDWAPRADIDTNKLQFFRVFYKRQDRDLASLSQKWKADAANTSVGGLTATAGTAADSTHEFYLLERAEQGKTS